MAEIDSLFNTMLEHRASDLHLSEGHPPRMRVDGSLRSMDMWGAMEHEKLEGMMREICVERRWKRFQDSGDLDFAYALGDKARFRANYNRQHTGLGAVFRTIPHRIQSLEELGMPAVLHTFADYSWGLILVTGPTGSGKSTTLAAVIDDINSSSARHILTIEEPVEFVHPHKLGAVVQREVGMDTPSFTHALKAAAREDVDVILVGEMRDLETISLAVTAAETGTLVFGTLHTNSASKSVDRMIDVFPADGQNQIRQMLAVSLKAVAAQLLLKKKGGGRVAASEVMLQTRGVSNCIREGKTMQLLSHIISGKGIGMQLMDDCIDDLVQRKIVEGRDAYMKALDKERFKQFAPIEGEAD